MQRASRYLGLVLMFAWALASTARAQNIYSWTNTFGGSFTNNLNWSPNSGPPSVNDTGQFNQAATYTVTFETAVTNRALFVNAGTVTMNLGGNVYIAGQTTDPNILIDNATLNVMGGGQLRNDSLYSASSQLRVSNGGVLNISGGSKVYSGPTAYSAQADGTSQIVVDGGEFHDLANNPAYFDGNITVINGGLFDTTAGLQPGVGTPTWIVSGLNSRLITDVIQDYNSTLRDLVVTNGGSLVVDSSLGLQLFGGYGQGTNTIDIGGAGLSATLISSGQVNFSYAGSGFYGTGRINVHTNGTLRIVGGSGSNLIIGDGSTFSYDVSRKSMVTLDSGAIQMGAGRRIMVEADGNADTNSPTLRGVGTISKFDAGANFSVVNEGLVRPGDTSDTPAIGTIRMQNGNLYQTNGAAILAGLRLDFNPSVAGAADLLDLTGGNVTITAGSNVFNNITGALAIGYGKWDFIKADSITYTPAYDNLSNLVAGLTMPVGPDFIGWSYGVVHLPTYDLLELSINMIPEPSTVLLLLGGGGLLWWSKRKKR